MRRTLTLEAPTPGQAYFYYPIVLDSALVRYEARPRTTPADSGAVAAEVLIKGSLPDDCTELHSVRQSRAGNYVQMEFLMRRPQKAVCRPIRQPYRFYQPLEGLYRAGSYTLKINGKPTPFEVRFFAEGRR